MDDRSIGARVKKIRKDKGLRQDQAARILGISTTGWQKIERNESLPGADTLLQFEKFGADPGWVLTGNHSTNPKYEGFGEPQQASPYSYPGFEPSLEENISENEQSQHLDTELLELVVVTVEDFLASHDERLAPDKLWLTYMTCYRLLHKNHEEYKGTSSTLGVKKVLQDILCLSIK
ncbi:helix-turn-helix domain-containing protein [Cohaesibacter gelatinilyticus]|uniref:Transcriptional regulator, contains XRE-family HTH domain n=1 Tax=Cohaesibacter gelatinilyticus TaxID=372072 RepID=A0A285PLC8_9HYPH|nr:helix-turn-helix transcriptional regulator [Cohaesibacter gelatinilyticus]SNZ20906.1 Transcriptional regulator, contains XRE-family HTH domain [Cohaesibacter gelatinilyticus]